MKKTALLKMYILLCLIMVLGNSAKAQDNMEGEMTSNALLQEYNDHKSLFKGGHEDHPLAVVIGYVNKNWRTDFGNKIVRENLWGQEDKKIHGVQLGVSLQPCAPIGIGLHTGLFYEHYFSVSSAVKDAGYDDFSENCLYFPFHALYRLPLGVNSSISFYGGIGLNVVLWGSYNNDYRNRNGEMESIAEAYQSYDVEGEPKRVNWQWELGGHLIINRVQIGFTYSRGLTNHHFYDGYNTQQNKISITLGVAIAE